MYLEDKTEIIKTALKLIETGIIKSTTGNLSKRVKDHVIITPSGMDYKEIEENDMVVLDLEGKVIEGKRLPSKEKEGCLYIYRKMTWVNAVIHTHQVYATAVGLISDKLPVILTTLASAVGGEVKVTPYAPAGSLETGKHTVEYVGNTKAVILKQHGVNVIGKDLNEALHAAIYLEEAAQTYLLVKSICEPEVLNDWQIKKAHEVYKDYLVEK